MVMIKNAFAPVVTRTVQRDQWRTFRKIQGSKSTQNVRTAYAGTPDKDVLNLFDPNRYILSHSTIIASVDTESVPDVNLGEDLWERGRRITRLWDDYRITKETEKYVNCNADAWERQLLLKTFWTFIGGYNYQEHIQDPELSKGILLDAVARDLGDTVYIDLLVATDRVHAQLARDIVSGKMKTMSMGCSIQFSLCTHCGNVATDEDHMCTHIKLQKGDTFVDEDGRERKIAELCGHRDVPDSVTFFEASWVEIPAFEGAHVRTVLYVPPDLDLDSTIHNAMSISSLQAPSLRTAEASWMDSFRQDALILSSTFGNRAAFNFGGDEEEGGDAPKEKEKSYMEEVLDESKQIIKDKLKGDIKQELVKDLNKKDHEKVKNQDPMPEAENANDNIIHASRHLRAQIQSMTLEGTSQTRVFHAALRYLTKSKGQVKTSEVYIDQNSKVYALMALDRMKGLKFSSAYYALLRKAEAMGSFEKFAKICEVHLKRSLTKGERNFLAKRSQMLRQI